MLLKRSLTTPGELPLCMSCPFSLENLVAKTRRRTRSRRRRRQLISALPYAGLIQIFHFPVHPITFHIYRKMLADWGRLNALSLYFLDVRLFLSLRRMNKKSNFPNWVNHLFICLRWFPISFVSNRAITRARCHRQIWKKTFSAKISIPSTKLNGSLVQPSTNLTYA